MWKNKYTIIAIFLVSLGLVFYLLRNQTVSDQALEEVDLVESKSQGDELMQEVEKLNEEVESSVPADLLACDPELFDANCSDLPKDQVCGYDHTIYGNGKEADHALTYKTACHYCIFFGEDMVQTMTDTEIQGLGYTEGPCQVK